MMSTDSDLEVTELRRQAEEMLAASENSDIVILETVLAENNRFRNRNRTLLYNIWLLLFGLGVLLVIVVVWLGPTASDTNDIVNNTVSRLERRVEEQEEVIKDADFVIKEQALPAIQLMQKMLDEAGIDPPPVILDPGHRPKEE